MGQTLSARILTRPGLAGRLDVASFRPVGIGGQSGAVASEPDAVSRRCRNRNSPARAMSGAA